MESTGEDGLGLSSPFSAVSRRLLPVFSPISDMARGMTKTQLRKEFKRGATEVLSERDFVTKEQAEELVDDALSDAFTVDQLKENLPDDVWEEVKEHLSDPEVPEADDGEEEMPEIEPDDETVKARPSNLRPQGTVEEGDVAPSQVFGDTTVDDDLEVKAEFDLTESSEALDLFYEGVE